MAENWCKEHQTAWFKKGAMKGYAHPILDEEGEKTGEWCNRPKDYQPEKEKPEEAPESKSSPEKGLAYKLIGEHIIAGQITSKSFFGQTGMTATAYAFALWHSYWQWIMETLGIKVEKEDKKEP